MTKMMDQRIFVFVLLMYLFAGSNSQWPGPVCSDPSQQLMNTVVYEGDSSSFFNQFDPNNVKWEIAPSHDPNVEPNPPYLVVDDGVTPYPDVYTVTPTQLSIPTASIYNYSESTFNYSTSGLYVLTYKTDDCTAMANLIVVSRGPECQCTTIDPDNAQLSCEIEYGVTRILPNYATMTWTTESGDEAYYEVPTPNQDQPSSDISISTYQTTSSGAASYTCEVTFTPPDASWLPNMASNAPTFSASCMVANCAIKTTITTIGPESTTTTPNSNSQGLGPPCNDPNQQLVNTVVYEGDSSSFFNQFDSIGVTWQIAPSYDPNASTNPPYLVADDGVTSYPGVYAVTPTQLSVPTASIYPLTPDPYSTSGLYIVTYKTDGCQEMANLIVVTLGPLCQCTMIDQDNAQLSCEIQYGATRMLPNYATMTWTTDSGDEAYYEEPTPNLVQPYYVISTSTYQTTSSGAASYTCEVTFTPPDSSWIPNMATNAPTFSASCTVANCVKTAATTTIEP